MSNLIPSNTEHKSPGVICIPKMRKIEKAKKKLKNVQHQEKIKAIIYNQKKTDRKSRGDHNSKQKNFLKKAVHWRLLEQKIQRHLEMLTSKLVVFTFWLCNVSYISYISQSLLDR